MTTLEPTALFDPSGNDFVYDLWLAWELTSDLSNHAGAWRDSGHLPSLHVPPRISNQVRPTACVEICV